MQKSKSAQVKKINALFSSSREQQQQRKSIDGSSIESSSTYKYGIHLKRQSSIDSTLSSDLPFYYNFNMSKNSQSSSATPSSRRQSYTEGLQSTDGGNGRLRKKNSWNSNSTRNIEHPSAFPSLLRSETPTSSRNYQNGHNNNGGSKNDSYSSLYSRQNGNATNATNLRRRASMSALVNSKKHQQQKQQQESISNLFSYKDTTHMHGSNIYLRADSFGNLNLVRRDSMVTPRRDSSVPLDMRSSPPRDYVSTTLPKRKGSGTLSAGRKSEERRSSSSMSISSLPTLNGRKSSTDQLHQSCLTSSRRSTESPFREDILERHVRILDLNSDSDGNKHPTSSSTPKRSSFGNSSNLGNASNGNENHFYTNRTRRMSTDSLDHQRRSSFGDDDDVDGISSSRRKYSTSSDTKKIYSQTPTSDSFYGASLINERNLNCSRNHFSDLKHSKNSNQTSNFSPNLYNDCNYFFKPQRNHEGSKQFSSTNKARCSCKNSLISKSMEEIRSPVNICYSTSTSASVPNNSGSGSNGKQRFTNKCRTNNNGCTNTGSPVNCNGMTRKDPLKTNNLNSNSNINNNYKHYSVDNLVHLGSELRHIYQNESDRPHFIAVTTLEDTQAIRCAEFHPNGKIYGVGSNTKTFRICEYPLLSEIGEDHVTHEPNIVFKKSKYHKGSIYCMSWAPDGELLATGSNDKTIKLIRYDETTNQLEGRETELTMHDGTIRDLCFLEDATNKASLLISGGAGDCKIYVTDCGTATPFQALSGHSGHILSVYNWGGAMFVSGSQDKTIRFWDLRTRGCVNTITPATTPGTRQGSPVASVCVDPSGRLLVSGHEDSSCVLYDIRGNRPIQCFKPHTAEIRSIRFSPSAYYLLTTGYDNKIVLSDLQGDLTLPLPSVTVAYHSDKVISGRWHPNDFSFVTTSADKMAILWALPPS